MKPTNAEQIQLRISGIAHGAREDNGFEILPLQINSYRDQILSSKKLFRSAVGPEIFTSNIAPRISHPREY